MLKLLKVLSLSLIIQCLTDLILSLIVENVKATKVVKGDDVINTIQVRLTDTILQTNKFSTTSTRKHEETKTIEDQAFADKTRTVVQTQETEVQHRFTNTATDIEDKIETKTHHVTDEVEVEVTQSVTDVVDETAVHSKTATHVISTEVRAKTTKTVNVAETLRLTNTKVSKTTAVHDAYATNVIIDNDSVTLTDSVDQVAVVDQTVSRTSTKSHQETIRNTKFITHDKTATSFVASTSTAIVRAASTVTHACTVDIDADLKKTITLPADIAAADAVVWATVYNTIQEYVTANHTDGTATVTNTNWVTVTVTDTLTAGAIFTTVTVA